MKILYFEGAGSVPRSDLGNCRIRTAVHTDDGTPLYLEIVGVEFADLHRKSSENSWMRLVAASALAPWNAAQSTAIPVALSTSAMIPAETFLIAGHISYTSTLLAAISTPSKCCHHWPVITSIAQESSAA